MISNSSLVVVSRDWEQPIIERRSGSMENPQTPLSYPAEWLLDIFNGGRTDSGIRVSELTAFQTSTFLSCVDLIAGCISSLPFHIYQQLQMTKGPGRSMNKIARDHYLYDFISMEPNEEMTMRTMMKAYLLHALAWGNGYSEIQRGEGNEVVAIWPRNPSKTRAHRLTQAVRLEAAPWRPFPVLLEAGQMVYTSTDGIDTPDIYEDGSGPERIIPMTDMLHIPGISFDGRVGQSVVWLARQTIGLALATEKFGAKYFANFARPGGILKMPMNVSDPAKEAAKRSWQEAQGGENSNRIAVMPPGFEWVPMSNNPEESQSVETQKLVRSHICAIFHVPPHMVGDVDKGRSNTEQLAQEFMQYTLAPWLMAIKQEWKRKLFPHRGVGRTPRNSFFVDFDLSEMMRPDADSRGKFYTTGRNWGFLSINDCRASEKLAPVEEDYGEEFIIPINMTRASTPLDPSNQDGSGKGPAAPEPLKRPYMRLFRDAFGRLLNRDQRDTRTIERCFAPILYAIRDMLSSEAAIDMRTEAVQSSESNKFISDYFTGMAKRAEGWTQEAAEQICDQELDRAIRALRVAVYRETAAAKAKEPTTIS